MQPPTQTSLEQMVGAVSDSELTAAMLQASQAEDPATALRSALAEALPDAAVDPAVPPKQNDQRPSETERLIAAVNLNELDSELPAALRAAPLSDRPRLKRIDRVTTELAGALRAEAQRICDSAGARGLAVSPAMIPERVVAPLGTLLVDGPAGPLADLLTADGYEEQRFSSDGPPVFTHPAHAVRFSVFGTDSETAAARVDDVDPGTLGGLLSTPTGLIQPLLHFAELQPGEMIVDLGCGDARVLIEAVKNFDARAIGIESDAAVVELARKSVERAGLVDEIEITHSDASEFDVGRADVVFAFVPPDAAQALIERVQPALKSGARLVVHEILPIDYPQPPDSRQVLVSPASAETEHGVTVAAKWRSNATAPSPVVDVSAFDEELIWVALEERGDRPPIFALHVIGAGGDKWRPISQHLGSDQPFYCLSDVRSALDAFDLSNYEAFGDIAAIAATYAASIQRAVKSGPVVLAGFCQGGLLAYEVAQRLQSAGIEVRLIVTVMDWHAPFVDYSMTLIDRARFGRALRDESWPEYVVGAVGRANFVPLARRSLELGQVFLAERLTWFDSEALTARRRSEEAIADIESYEYLPYGGAFGVIRGSDDPRLTPEHGSTGWGDLVEHLDVRWLPGASENLLAEPYVRETAKTVAEWLGNQ